MTAMKTTIALAAFGFAIGLGACTVYVVPAEERDEATETLVETDDQGSEKPADTQDAAQPPETEVRRRDEALARDSASAEAEREARAREEVERQAREAERRAREEAEGQAREEAERQARLQEEREAAEREAAERAARLAAEREAREAAERAAREREARLQAEREARLAAEREAAEREAAEREAAEREAEEREARLAAEREASQREARARARAGSRELHVPPGHHPPEGQCRIWYEDRPPGRQPAAAPCEELLADDLEDGAFILYGGVSWDGSHDWEAAELEYPGAVPRPVLALSRVVGGDEGAQEESEPATPSDDAEEQDAPEPTTPPENRPGRGRAGSSPGPR